MNGASMQVPQQRETLSIGVLAPLRSPGWAEAGRSLLAGLRLAAEDINTAGGVGGRRLELLIRDTAADPALAVAAVDELDDLGVCALAGEYHSVVAGAVAARAHARHIPFVCSSAVMDALTEETTDWVARIAPVQSRGWRFFAQYLVEAGHRRVALLAQESRYWMAGAKILEESLRAYGGEVFMLDASRDAGDLTEALAATGARCALLLAGFPDPVIDLVHALRGDPRFEKMLLGAPAGQPELASWLERLGAQGAGVPFLRYMPPALTQTGIRAHRRLSAQMQGDLSFVALEGYDTLLVLSEIIRRCGADRAAIAGGFARCEVTGTRGKISFSRVPGVPVWQWAWPDIQIVARAAADPESFLVLADLSGS